MRAASPACLLALLLATACAPPADLPAQLRAVPTPDAGFPDLEPLAPLLARAQVPGRVTA